jgi:hypothetical protein
VLYDISANDHPEARALIAGVELNSGSKSAIVFAGHLLDAAVVYLIERLTPHSCSAPEWP